MVEAFWRQLGNPLGQLKSLGVAELKSGSVVQFTQLFGNRFGNLRTVMPSTTAPEPGKTVEYPAAFSVDIVAAFGTDNQAWVRFELAVCGVRQPVGVKLLGGQSSMALIIVIRHNITLCVRCLCSQSRQ